MTYFLNYAMIPMSTTVLPTDSRKEENDLNHQQITALYCRLGNEDDLDGESNSIQNQELLCRGWFLPPNTYDCGSFVVNRKAVVGKE